MQKYTCLLVDLDGTLMDFDKAELTSLEKTFQKHKIEFTKENVKKYDEINKALWRAYERGEIEKDKLVIKRYADFLEALKINGNAEEINTFYLNELSKRGETYEGAKEFLEKIHTHHIVVIATNGVAKTQNGRVKAGGLEPLVHFVINSEEAGAAKPDEDFFKYAMNIIGNIEKDSILMIGDSLTADIQGGINFGIDTCWYNPENEPVPDNIKPTYIATNYEDVLRVIERGELE